METSAGLRSIRISLFPSRAEPEWFSREEAIHHLFDVLLVRPVWDGARDPEDTGDHGYGQDVYDSPWDRPEVVWRDDAGVDYCVEASP